MEKMFLDSSLPLYAAGNIGYRWAVKVMKKVSIDNTLVYTDTLFFQEVIDWFMFHNKRDHAQIVFHSLRKIVKNVIPLSVNDFELMIDLSKKYSSLSPRALIHVAVMKNNNIHKIISTYSSDIDEIKEIRRINLIEEVKK